MKKQSPKPDDETRSRNDGAMHDRLADEERSTEDDPNADEPEETHGHLKEVPRR